VLSRPRVSAYQHYPQPGPVNWVRTFSKLEYNKGLTDFHVGGVAAINSQKFLLARKTLMEVLQRVQSHAKQLDLIRRQPKQSIAESMRALHMRNRKARTVGIQSYTTVLLYNHHQPSIGTSIRRPQATPSWGYVGPSWGLCCPILRLCWPMLKPMMAHVDPSWATRSEKWDKIRNSKNHRKTR